MAFEYFANVGRIIGDKYDGNPTERDGFIAAIKLADSASTQAQQPQLVEFIRSRSKGKVQEYITDDVTTATRVIEILKEKIKVNKTVHN